MGRIRVLSDHVANKIAAGEVVERPASVVKELLENALDAGAQRIRITVEGGGSKLIAITDDGCGMGRDDALLAFERHATSKIRDLQDLDEIATLGFRGEALPAIASVARLTLETRTAEAAAGTRLEISGGKLLRVDDAGVPPGTSIRVEDLFFNVPARRKFLKAEATELAHIALVVTHYALAHPEKHLSLDTPSHQVLDAAPAASHEERLYAIFGREARAAMIPLAAERPLDRAGLPPPPPWRRSSAYTPPPPGRLRLYGFVSKPELQKLNRNSIYLFVNGRVVRDRLLQHALSEAYRNLLPPAAFPVALLFLELPPSEVDANVHPAKTEVRFRQSAPVHDFVRDAARAALDAARPLPEFTRSISSHPTSFAQATASSPEAASASAFALEAVAPPAYAEKLAFSGAIALDGDMAANPISLPPENLRMAAASRAPARFGDTCAYEVTAEPASPGGLASLRPLGQLRDSFILAVNGEGLWIIDQHTAHERVLFERLLRERESSDRAPRGQRLLLPIVIELTPSQWPVFALIAAELERNGFEAEPFGARTIAVKTAPAGLRPADLERLLGELIEQLEREQQAENLATVRQRIAATVACHAAVKVNMPLDPAKLAWLLAELARTESPMTCPHGRPVVLHYGVEEIQKAFKRTWGKF